MNEAAQASTSRAQVSAIERLLSLPPLFRGSDLTVRFQWTSKTASQYIYLWKKRNLVQGLGGHSDVFANLLREPAPNWEQALVMSMPSAIITGVEALRRAGWTTQIQRSPDVAVRADQSVFNLGSSTSKKLHTDGFDGFTVKAHSAAWFDKVLPDGVTRSESGRAPVLKPAWALADMLATEGWGKCGLWPDDIYLDDATSEDTAEWVAACAAFGLEVGTLEAQSESSR